MRSDGTYPGGSATRMWLVLLTAELVLFAASSAFYSVNEGWSFERSMFVSVSIGFGIGLPYQTSEATALVAAANALVGFALLAFAASLLLGVAQSEALLALTAAALRRDWAVVSARSATRIQRAWRRRRRKRQ